MIRRLRLWLAQLLQRIARVYYEGPEPPPRLQTSVQAFTFTHPIASREQWAQFALEMAEEAYKSGFQRGFEQRVEDTQALLQAGVVVPLTKGPVLWEHVQPHKLVTEEKLAETVELRAESAQVVKVPLEQALVADPKLREQEESFWRKSAGFGPGKR